MEHYVTLFDSLFLPQGLALHMSMERHVKDYTLWILCVDDDAHAMLSKLELPNVRLLQLSKLETEELLRVKPTRSKGEYCWTLTPFAPRFVFNTDESVKRVTYLDADMAFFDDPGPIFKDFEKSLKSILITKHSYGAANDSTKYSGKYCVQFMIFKRDDGEEVRKWWADKCIEWCYAKFEGGKFGDQKYLDQWPKIFSEFVHVSENTEYFQAPWNCNKYPYSDAILYHFHGLRIVKSMVTNSPRIFFSGEYIPKKTIDFIYLPYCDLLSDAVEKIKNIDSSYIPRAQSKINKIALLWRLIKRIRDFTYSFHCQFNTRPVK